MLVRPIVLVLEKLHLMIELGSVVDIFGILCYNQDVSVGRGRIYPFLRLRGAHVHLQGQV